MSFKITQDVQNAILNLLKTNLADGIIRVYQGTIPNSAADAVDNVNDLLVQITEGVGATGINLGTAASGVISKAAAEEWYGTVLKTGTATYYRYTAVADTGGADANAFRVQGAIGELVGELLLADTDLVLGDVQRIDYYSIGMPSE